MFCCLTTNKKKFSWENLVWQSLFETDKYGRQGAAVHSKEKKTLFPGVSWPRSSMTPMKKPTAPRAKLVPLLAGHLSVPQWLCQAAGAVLGCSLAGLSSRIMLAALALRFSTSRCPFCFWVQQRSKWGGSPAQNWLYSWCGPLPAGSACCQATHAPVGIQAAQGQLFPWKVSLGSRCGEALRPGTLPGARLPRTLCTPGYLLGHPGIHLSQLRTRPHPNWSWFLFFSKGKKQHKKVLSHWC